MYILNACNYDIRGTLRNNTLRKHQKLTLHETTTPSPANQIALRQKYHLRHKNTLMPKKKVLINDVV